MARKWGDRRDGVWLRDLDSMHAFMPYLMGSRADNEAFIRERIDLTALDKYLAEKTKGDPEFKYTVFHAILAAAVKTVTLRPEMNRFIAGHRIYMRNEITAAFTMKKKFTDGAHEALAFLHFTPDDNIDTIHQKLKKEITTLRKDNVQDNSTDAMDVLVKLPRPILRFFIKKVLFWLEYHGIAPQSLIKTDPYHATMFLSNLGSIKLNAGYHHLVNWGTNSFFMVIGEMGKYPYYDDEGHVEMRNSLELGLTIDERIADGYYYSKTVKLLKHLLAHPELLDTPASQEVDY